MTNPMTIDPEIDSLCEAAIPAVAMLASVARLWWEHRHGAQVRAMSGYMPPAQRRAVAHRLYSDSLVKPPARPTSDERAKASAKLWHGPRPALACEVRP